MKPARTPLPVASTLDCSHSASRRRWLVHATAIAAAAASGRLAAAPTDDTIRLGQSAGLTGPLGELGKAIHYGARAAFDEVNAQGGVHGRRIELIVKDDGYTVPRSQENTRAFLADPNLFALFTPMGTPNVEAMLPLIRNTDVPCFAPLTGGLVARPADMPNVMNVRPSYPEEAERLVEHLSTIGIRRIAIAYQNNAFGKEVLKGTETAAKKHGVTLAAAASIVNDASDAGAAVTKIVDAAPEAVLLGLAGKPTIDFVKGVRAVRKGLPLYALSVMGSASTLAALGNDAYGIAVTQVVPLPSNAVVPVVRDFLQAWRASGTQLAPSHLALEGYINARVFAEALRRAGRNPTRKAFIDSAWALKRYDLGGFDVSFDQPGRNASRFVELTMISHAGKFIR
jgi:branched-chain amino acid transport system substrate-binding protein